jgi:hypothetical protein
VQLFGSGNPIDAAFSMMSGQSVQAAPSMEVM